MIFEGLYNQAKEELVPHRGHRIEIVFYTLDVELSVECLSCHEVLITFPAG